MPIDYHAEDDELEVEASVSENAKYLAALAEFPLGCSVTFKGHVRPVLVVQGVWQDQGEVLVGCLWFNAQDRLEEKEFIPEVLQKVVPA
jgi:hypothetical protein